MKDVAYHRFADPELGEFAGEVDHTDPFSQEPTATYEAASWTSPVARTGFTVGELVPTWDADTPDGSWLQVEAALVLADGGRSGWYVMARWTSTEGGLCRTTVPGQKDGHAEVHTDVLAVSDRVRAVGWQLRAVALRPLGSTATPRLRSLGAMASAHPHGPVEPSDRPGEGSHVLDVPAYSQQRHRGEHPEWDSGGASWCSATSMAMVLDHWKAGPDEAETAWVEPGNAHPQVVHAVRAVYDHAYDGAGNWAFNTAYAGQRGLCGFVTRLRGLDEAELFTAAGIPLVASVSFTREELDGAGYDTKGHLLVIVGFDERGDVVVNDPASHELPDDDEVRATYDRGQFEQVWGRSGGLVYVIHPEDTPLPPHPRPEQPSW